MPCDSRITNEVEFKAGTDMALMREALEAAGYRVYEYQGGIGFTHTKTWTRGGKFLDGVFTVTEGTDATEIKREYSKATVKATAKRLGWTVKVDAKNPLKMQVMKRQ